MNHLLRILHFRIFNLLLILLGVFGLSGCDLIGDIFEAGFWVAIILVVIVVLIVGWVIRKFRK